MNQKEFNEYKSGYATMPFREVQGWHTRLWKDYPDQNYYNSGTLQTFFNVAAGQPGGVHVCELGGWRGEAAKEIMEIHGPTVVKSWTNYEVCKEAAAMPVCKDLRYYAPQMRTHLFDKRKAPVEADVFVTSHCIEHLIAGQVDQLLEKLATVQWLYIDTPLLRGPRTHEGTDFHVYEYGWDHLAHQIATAGYHEKGRRDFARWYKRG